MRQRQAAQGLQQKDRAEGMAGRSGRPGDHEADSGRCGDRQDRSTGYGCPESGEHYDPAAGKATERGQQKAGQPDEGHRCRVVRLGDLKEKKRPHHVEKQLTNNSC